MNLPANRHMDPRWNRAQDAQDGLVAVWNELGPDRTFAALSALTERDPTWDEAVAAFEAGEPVELVRPGAATDGGP